MEKKQYFYRKSWQGYGVYRREPETTNGEVFYWWASSLAEARRDVRLLIADANAKRAEQEKANAV